MRRRGMSVVAVVGAFSAAEAGDDEGATDVDDGWLWVVVGCWLMVLLWAPFGC